MTITLDPLRRDGFLVTFAIWTAWKNSDLIHSGGFHVSRVINADVLILINWLPVHYCLASAAWISLVSRLQHRKQTSNVSNVYS